MNYTDTRARSSDPQTSKDAAKSARSYKSAWQRSRINAMIGGYTFNNAGWTAKELSECAGIPLPDVYRRLPECAGTKPHETMRRDGCRVWVKA